MITLYRSDYAKEGTYGILKFGDFICYTVEKPWLNNTPFTSCIPEGEYALQRVPGSQKFPYTHLVLTSVHHAVYRYQNPLSKRYGILIHRANIASELQGCIALGNDVGMMKGEKAVFNSRPTLRKFLDLNPEEYVLNITSEVPEDESIS